MDGYNAGAIQEVEDKGLIILEPLYGKVASPPVNPDRLGNELLRTGQCSNRGKLADCRRA